MSIQYTADQLQRKFRGATGSPVFSRLAEVLRSEGRIDEAIQTCQEGLRARPNTLSGLVVLGKSLLDAGRVEESREQFESALRLDPRCLSAMHYLARIMTKMQWTDAAAGYYRSILEVEPWDAEIRALLDGAPQSPSAPISAEATVFQESAAPITYASPAEEDTFHKPEGFAGDVMEVNLNDMAADFLPGQDDMSLSLAEESLEDALSASQEPMAHQPRYDAPPEPIAEPRPMDVLKDEPGALSSMDGEAPPISGQDVEDRLDSLFGVEDSPSQAMRDATATWSPAPPEAPDPEIPPAPDFFISDPASAATAIGELRASETGEMRLPVESAESAESDYAPAEPVPAEALRPFDLTAVPDLPAASGTAEVSDAFEAMEIPGVQDFSAVDFETPLEQRAPAGTGAFADQDVSGPEDRVHGEDIERRLDELFNLTEEDNRPPTESSILPVAPGPEMGEAISLGEVVSFGGEVAFDEPVAVAAVNEDSVTGQDVADKLDKLFGSEPAGESDTKAESKSDSPFLSSAAAAPAPAFKEPTPWPADDMESAQPFPSGDVMSTESMVPPGWFGEAGDGPRVTGADVEAQLDKLFHIEEDGETLSGATSAQATPSVGADDAVDLFESPGTDTLASQAERPMPGDEADLTVMMPAMLETPSAQTAQSAQSAPTGPNDTNSIKESVADWLARRSDDADKRTEAEQKSEADKYRFPTHAGQDFGAGDTLILPAEDVLSPDFDAALELSSSAGETSLGAFQDEDSFDTLAPEDSALLSETTSIEMVDGEDVAGRLDELFADEVPLGDPSFANTRATGSIPEGEMSLFSSETGENPEMAGVETMESVSGEDVSSRLQQLFEAGDSPAGGDAAAAAASQPETGVAVGSETDKAGSETDEDRVPLTGFAKPTGTEGPAAPAAPQLAPMSDEEDPYPDEDDMAAQAGAGANVATVTLAEIYFQQGLREQALQIYRQLLEREPENDSVRKRIEEIEATKPDGGEPGPGSDPRRPRPGLKVPKRKK